MGKRQPIEAHTEMAEILESPHKNFKATMIKKCSMMNYKSLEAKDNEGCLGREIKLY